LDQPTHTSENELRALVFLKINEGLWDDVQIVDVYSADSSQWFIVTVNLMISRMGKSEKIAELQDEVNSVVERDIDDGTFVARMQKINEDIEKVLMFTGILPKLNEPVRLPIVESIPAISHGINRHHLRFRMYGLSLFAITSVLSIFLFYRANRRRAKRQHDLEMGRSVGSLVFLDTDDGVSQLLDMARVSEEDASKATKSTTSTSHNGYDRTRELYIDLELPRVFHHEAYLSVKKGFRI